MIKDKPIRADLGFIKDLDEIKEARREKGVDKPKSRLDRPKTKSDRRLTQAITRHRFWKIIKEDMINAEMLD